MTAPHVLSFYPGLHQPHDAVHFDRACISIHRLETRRKPVPCPDVMVDSGAFTKLAKHGCYPEPVAVYARQLHRLWTQGVVNITIAAAQDYMCEPFMLEKTGLTVLDHQRLTIERYDALVEALDELFPESVPFEVMPVLQGFLISDYLRHIEMYGHRLTSGMWVGVGSVCKRQGNAAVIEDLLLAIKGARSDLRLHGFRRETDSPAKPHRAAVAVQRRQHGVVLRCPEVRSRLKRLAGSQGFRASRPNPIKRAGAVAAVRGMRRQPNV